MSKFKKLMSFTSGEVLKTRKGILTDWTFINEAHSNAISGRRYINATCKCGREKIICLNNVRSGTSSSCGLSPCRGTEREKDIEVGYKAILYVYKKHAKDRGFTFDLDYDYFKELTKGNCHYCGIKPIQVYQLKNPKTGKIKKVSFGAKDGGGNLSVKLKDPKARKRFADRHNCEQKNDRTTPGYWSCRLPRYAKQLGLSGGGRFW